jgi:type I restriction enzyme, S subunit
MSYKRLGDYIQVVVENKNSDLEFTNLLGINITNNFMPSVANRNGLDLSKYKIVRKKQFATNIMHVGRDERLPVALYHDNEPAIVSPAYKVFEVIDEKELLPEYLMIEFQRPEFHRLAWYYCDSSVRGGLDWDRFCEIQLPIPDDIEEQRKYVNIYKGLLRNQHCYAKSLNDLQLICDTYIENLIKKEKPKRLGAYIEASGLRNKKGDIQLFQGINNKKEFITPKQIGANIYAAKIVKKGQFGYNKATTRNGEKLSIAYRTGADCAVSSAYQVFEIHDKEKLLPEYLLMYFKRKEFDRYAIFKSEGSAHEFFDYDKMCDLRLPIPDIKIQEAIVTIYHTLETRKRLNEELKGKIKPLCPILMRGVVENSLKPQAV